MGDHDASGHDIERNFLDKVGHCFEDWSRVALTPELVEEHNLPQGFGKKKDPRRNAFVKRYGDVQVEVEALTPELLQSLITDAVMDGWDDAAYEEVTEREEEERDRITEIADEFDNDN